MSKKGKSIKKKVQASSRKRKNLILYNRKGETRVFLFLSFIIPFLVMLYAFAQFEVYPFGDKQILVTDLWHQYFPFFREMQEKLKDFSSLLYSWHTGLGTNFLSIISYYGASPLNLLSIFFPMASSREVLTLFLMIKIGCAGLFFAIFLKHTFGKNDISITAFSLGYALCSYIMGYYWNLIWIDTVALLPLVVLGTIKLVKEGKYKLYVISLALSLISNFYIGLFTCVFTVMVFAAACIITGSGIKGTFKRLGQIAGATVLGLGMAAFMLLPAFLALQLTNSVDNTFPSQITFYESWRTMLSNVIGYHEPAAKEGLPNFYCGVFGIVLLAAYLRTRKVLIREKIITVLYLAFIVVSCNMNVLNYMWHGFHFTNMIPYRFAFLFSFILLAAGYRVYTVLAEEAKLLDVLAMSVMIVLVAVLSYKDQSEKAVIYTVVTALIYTAIMWLKEFKLINRTVMNYSVFVVMLVEMTIGAYIGVKEVSVTTRSVYPNKNDNIQSLLSYTDDDKDGFFRTEIETNYTLNDPALYGYNGMSQFSSTANVNVTRFMQKLGYYASAAGNRYYYEQNTPFASMMLSMKYFISNNSTNYESYYSEIAASDGKVILYKNKYHLPLGFMTDSALATTTCDFENQFENQNELFRAATGLDGDLFTPIEVKDVGHENVNVSKNGYGSYRYQYVMKDTVNEGAQMKFNYLIPEECSAYMIFSFDKKSSYSIYNNEDYLVYNYGEPKYQHIVSAGHYKAGDVMSVKAPVEKDANSSGQIYVYRMDDELFRKGYELLSKCGMSDVEYTDRTVKGKVNAEKDGLFYTSIPNDGGWRVYADGKEVDVISNEDSECPLTSAMVTFNLPAGEHEIEMKYTPPGFTVGMIITIGSVVIFAAVWFAEKRYRKSREEA